MGAPDMMGNLPCNLHVSAIAIMCGHAECEMREALRHNRVECACYDARSTSFRHIHYHTRVGTV